MKYQNIHVTSNNDSNEGDVTIKNITVSRVSHCSIILYVKVIVILNREILLNERLRKNMNNKGKLKNNVEVKIIDEIKCCRNSSF